MALPPASEPPSKAGRVASVILKVVLVLVSLAALALGGAVAAAENKPNGAAAMVLVGIAVITIAVIARLRWSFLAVFIAVPVGLATCVSNFKWHGG